MLRFLFVGPWLLLPLGHIGLFLPSQRLGPTGFWVWASFVPIYGLSVAAFFVSDRYRMPLLVPLCVTSAAAIGWLVDRLRSRRAVRLVTPAIALGLAGMLTQWDLGLHDALGNERTRNAVWLVEQGKYDEARAYVTSISARHSNPGVLRYQVGEALMAAGRHEEAVERFREALEIDRDQAAIRFALGQALASAGRPGEAVPLFAALFEAGYREEVTGLLLIRALAASGRQDEIVSRLTSFPSDIEFQGETALEFGILALETQAPAQAERWLRIATERAPNLAEAHQKLGVALLLLQRAGEAVAQLETAVRDPASARAHLNLGVAYANLGRFGEARVQGREALRLDPNNQRADSFLKALPIR